MYRAFHRKKKELDLFCICITPSIYCLFMLPSEEGIVATFKSVVEYQLSNSLVL